jgi:uroporphyrin-III C-methyltransferase
MTRNADTGRVYLVGAGPGDPELLTLKAVRVLGEADLVLHDDLVDRRVLAFAKAGARVVAVGKRGGCRSTPQAFIDRLVVREARAGRVVVRLKGGDPMVFGRGGEEFDAVRAAGIACEVVSGITAAVAACAAAQIPLTDRRCAGGVALVTAHEAAARARTDWRALAASGLTLAIYMGVARAANVRDALIDAGLAATTPVAIIERASCANERVVDSTLDALARTVHERTIASPALLIVGDVAAARAARDRAPLRFSARAST